MPLNNVSKTIAAAALGVLATTAWAGPEAGDRTFTLSGSGTSDDSFDTTTFSASGELGWFTTDAVEWGFRQGVSVTALDNADDAWNGATRVFADYHFGQDPFRPFIGASVGGFYGENVNNTFAAGPEIGFKYYVRDKTFIELAAEYQFLFEDADEVDDVYDDGTYLYTLGVGYNF